MPHSSLQRSALTSALAIALFTPMSVLAQAQEPSRPVPESQSSEDSEQDSGSEQAKTLDTVTVTGSRIKRAQIEGPAPVTIIQGEEIKKRGFATVYDALVNVTAAIGGVQNDYDWGQTSVNASPLNLRNLGPGRTLLLINGHRVADYPMPYQGKSNFANFNNIPTGIVERIEILSGSASAIYGSDAMAGVVNVVLKKNIEDHTLRVKYGEATRGGYENLDVVLSGGTSGDNWNLVYNLQHFDRGVLLAGDRPFMDGEDDRDFATWGPAERRFGVGKVNPYPGLYLRDQDNPGPTGRTYIAPPDGTCEQYGDLYFRAERLGYDRNTGVEQHDGFYCAQNVFQNWALRTGSKDTSGYLYGTYDFNDGLQGWASLGYWKTTGEFNTFLDGFGSGDYWDPRANAGAGGTRNFLKFQSPQEMGGEDAILTTSDETAIDFSVGLNGRMFNDRFDWEAMVGRATYDIKERFPVLNQGEMSGYYLGSQQGTHTRTNADGSTTELPVYAPDYNKLWNPVPAGDIAGFRDRGQKKARSWLTQASFVMSGDLFEGWAGPIGFAGVIEAARQGYKLTPDPKTINQDEDGWYTPFGNIEQGGGERDRYAVGVEFNVPLAKTLTASVAGRYDDYDAVASDAATTYQLGLEWRPLTSLLLRGTYGTAFRAPDMHFVYAEPSTGISDFTDYAACYEAGFPERQCPRDTFKVEDATVSRQGTPNLLYEEGESFTYGFVWDAFEGFSLNADYWQISIDNLIDDVSADQVLIDEGYCQYGFMPDGSTRSPPPSDALCALQTGRVTRGPDPDGDGPLLGPVTRIETGPINRAETRVAGVDVGAHYNLDTDRFGTWNFDLGYTNQLKHETRGFPEDELVDDRAHQIRSKITLGASWYYDKWNATLFMYQKSGGRVVRWGGCLPFEDGYVPSSGTNCEDTDPLSPTFGQSTSIVMERREPRRYFNGSVGYQVTDALKFNLYVSNIFDKIYGDKWHGDFAYSVDDPIGRQVAAEVIYRFD